MPKKKDFKDILESTNCIEFILRDRITKDEAVFEVDRDAGETSATLVMNTGGSIVVAGRGNKQAQLEAFFSMCETICQDFKVKPEHLMEWVLDMYDSQAIEVEESEDFEDIRDRGIN